MKSKVIVSTQFYENYNVSDDGFNTNGDGQPHWKAKGGHEFEIVITLRKSFLIWFQNIIPKLRSLNIGLTKSNFQNQLNLVLKTNS